MNQAACYQLAREGIADGGAADISCNVLSIFKQTAGKLGVRTIACRASLAHCLHVNVFAWVWFGRVGANVIVLVVSATFRRDATLVAVHEILALKIPAYQGICAKTGRLVAHWGRNVICTAPMLRALECCLPYKLCARLVRVDVVVVSLVVVKRAV